MFCYEGRAGGVSEGFWKGGMRTFGNFGMEKGEGRREKGECTIWRIASTSSESVLFWEHLSRWGRSRCEALRYHNPYSIEVFDRFLGGRCHCG